MTYHKDDTSRKKELKRPVRSRAAKTMAGLSAALATVVLLAPGDAHALDCSNVNLPPTSKNDFKCLDKGFKVFTEETFEGNGRTCGTCHIPSEAYNIFPASIKKLSKAEKDLVFATNTPGLENKTLVEKFALFNIAGDANSNASDPLEWGPGGTHTKPIFRSAMGIFGLGVTSEPAASYPGTPLFPPVCSAGGLAALQPQLGWSGDGSPGTKAPAPNDVLCRTHHGHFDPDSDGSIRAFATGAIAQHNPKTLNRVPGVDFRRATALELDSMDALQKWLGRRTLSPAEAALNTGGTSPSVGNTEFDLSRLVFKDARIARGRDHYLGGPQFAPPPAPPGPPGPPVPSEPQAVFGSGCNGCHVNGGSRAPFPGGPPPTVPGGNININTDVEKGSDDAMFVNAVGRALPHDEGGSDSFGPPVPGFDESFNIQSIIEAPQKKAWFHNHRVLKDFEDSILFYTTDDFINPNNLPAPTGFFTTLEGLKFGDPGDDFGRSNYFPKGDGVEHLGAFLRTLNAYYNLRDCERLVKESIARINKGVSSKNSQQHCVFALNNARRVLKGIKLKKKPHQKVANAVPFLVAQLKLAQKTKSKLIYKLALKEITKHKKSIATQSTQVASAN